MTAERKRLREMRAQICRSRAFLARDERKWKQLLRDYSQMTEALLSMADSWMEANKVRHE